MKAPKPKMTKEERAMQIAILNNMKRRKKRQETQS